MTPTQQIFYELGRNEATPSTPFTSDIHEMAKEGNSKYYLQGRLDGHPDNTGSSRAPTADNQPPNSTGGEDKNTVAASAASKQ